MVITTGRILRHVAVGQVARDPPFHNLLRVSRSPSFAHETLVSRREVGGTTNWAPPHGDKHLVWRSVSCGVCTPRYITSSAVIVSWS